MKFKQKVQFSWNLRWEIVFLTLPHYVFAKLKFQVVVGNRFLYERLVVVVYKLLSTYLNNDNGDKVQLYNSIGEEKEKMPTEYEVILAKELTLFQLSTHAVQMFIMDQKMWNSTYVFPTHHTPSWRFEKQRGAGVLLMPNTLLFAGGAHQHQWVIVNKLDQTWKLPQDYPFGKEILQSAEIASISTIHDNLKMTKFSYILCFLIWNQWPLTMILRTRNSWLLPILEWSVVCTGGSRRFVAFVWRACDSSSSYHGRQITCIETKKTKNGVEKFIHKTFTTQPK